MLCLARERGRPAGRLGRQSRRPGSAGEEEPMTCQAVSTSVRARSAGPRAWITIAVTQLQRLRAVCELDEQRVAALSESLFFCFLLFVAWSDISYFGGRCLTICGLHSYAATTWPVGRYMQVKKVKMKARQGGGR
jgi:hypothetical protein